jgi:hypothetical protein
VTACPSFVIPHVRVRHRVIGRMGLGPLKSTLAMLEVSKFIEQSLSLTLFYTIVILSPTPIDLVVLGRS